MTDTALRPAHEFGPACPNYPHGCMICQPAAAPTEPSPAISPDGLCAWGHVELGRLTTLEDQLSRLSQRWRNRAKQLDTQAAKTEAAGDHTASAAADAAAGAIEALLAEIGELMARPGRKGPHANHLYAAQWHLTQVVAAQRRPGAPL